MSTILPITQLLFLYTATKPAYTNNLLSLTVVFFLYCLQQQLHYYSTFYLHLSRCIMSARLTSLSFGQPHSIIALTSSSRNICRAA